MGPVRSHRFKKGGGHPMRKLIPSLVVFALAVDACASFGPSLPYRRGQGFYSESFAKIQVQAAANAGEVKNLGSFSMNAGGCANYEREMTDRNLIIPAIQRKLKEMGANVADNVVASEKWYDFPLWFLIIPEVLGCSVWEVSGEALLVEQPAAGESRAMAQHKFGDVWVFFQYAAR
jgi:hypothetical protein